jgi:ABC-type multidrug transport system fused ATPase/permease subunit
VGARVNLPGVYVGERRWRLVALIGCGAAQALGLFGAASLMQAALDGALGGGAVAAQLVGLVGLGLLGALSRAAERHQCEQLGQHYAHDLRLGMFDALAAQPADARSSNRRGAVPLRFMSDLTALCQWLSLGQARLLVALPTLAAALGYLSTISLVLAAAAGGVLLAVVAASTALGQRLEQAVVTARQRRGRLANLTAERAGHMSALIGFGRLHSERERLARQSQRLADAMNQRALWTGALRAVNEFGIRAAIALVLGLGIHLLRGDLVSAGAILAAVGVVALMAAPVRDLGRVYEYWKAAKVARHKISQFLQTPAAEAPQRDRRLPDPRGALTLSRVRLRSGHRPLSLEVPAGAKVAVTGPNGAGKTTLLWALAGIRRPARGRIRLDLQPVHRLTERSLQRAIGIASTDLPLMKGSLRRNLRYRAPDADEAALRQACERTGIVPALGPWPDVLERPVQEAGSNLSEGERALVQLARALVHEPALLLLDELESHLDAAGRARLMAIIASYPGTVVFSTHDAAMTGLATRLWRLGPDGMSTVQLGRPVQVWPPEGALAALSSSDGSAPGAGGPS